MYSSLGWYVGYNSFIDVDGRFQATRKIGEETAAIKGHNCDIEENCDTISVCLAGDFNRELPTDKQVKSLREYIEALKLTYPDIKVTFHRALQEYRTCPGILFTDDYLKLAILQNTEELDKMVSDKQKIKELQTTLDQILSFMAKYIK